MRSRGSCTADHSPYRIAELGVSYHKAFELERPGRTCFLEITHQLEKKIVVHVRLSWGGHDHVSFIVLYSD